MKPKTKRTLFIVLSILFPPVALLIYWFSSRNNRKNVIIILLAVYSIIWLIMMITYKPDKEPLTDAPPITKSPIASIQHSPTLSPTLYPPIASPNSPTILVITTPSPKISPAMSPTMSPTISPTISPTQNISVWLSATGSKYHRYPDCGRMNPDKATQISLEKAKQRGFEPCDICNPPQ